jgi:sodium-coupled neutral amino acid transporter 2
MQFLFSSSNSFGFHYLRDPHSIAEKWDKILAVFMIVLAVTSNVVAVYSDAYSIFHKKSAPSQT